jgi:predicted  nucleic acid-binding Zn-ribbon protein
VSTLDDLLVVQEHDTAVDRLNHRRGTLPELAELARIENELAAVERNLGVVTEARDDVARRQRRHEDELGALEAKIAEVSGRMYSGAVSIPRELQAMQAELDSMARRRSMLEDDVLEAMTEREPLDEEVASLTARQAAHDETAARLRTAIAEAHAAIEAELEQESTARSAAAASVAADLLKLYEQIRGRSGGVGVARLAGARCGGCHLTLPATELDGIRRAPPDTVSRCEQCNRILVP